MTTLPRRLGLSKEEFGRIDDPLLKSQILPPSDVLFDKAFEVAPTKPVEAQTLLGTAILAQARQTSEGRLAAALSLLARLVASADPDMTLGPKGAALRDEIMPNGWRYTTQSWGRLRYAWREGLRDLLDVHDDDPIADALDEITRLDPAEPEPVAVAIQEQFPPPRIGFAITILGLGLTGYGVYSTMKRERAFERKVSRKKR